VTGKGSVPDVPFCVDLDGTLIAGDTQYEGLFALLRRNPIDVFRLPAWAFLGTAHLKTQIANRAPIDPRRLPYNPELMALLGAIHGKRPIIMCTASHHNYARAVADYLGIFEQVLATNGDVNFNAHRKAERLVADFGIGGFDYAGDQSSDLVVFAVARHAYAVNPSRRLRQRIPEIRNLKRVMDARPSRRWRTVRALIRIRRWLWNLVVFVPWLARRRPHSRRALARSARAYVVLGLGAMSADLLRDLLRLDADRAAGRRRGPIATGGLSIRAALVLIPLLFAAAIAVV
jgi:hypothetical protein